jgi:hypothetical protein
MFIDLPPDQPPAIVLAQAYQDRPASAERAIGWCLITENNPYSWVRTDGIAVDFKGAAINYMGYYGNENGRKYRSEKEREALRQTGDNGKVTIIQTPQHGRLVNTYTYFPEADYFGKDKVVALVELTSGEKVTVVFFINMVHHGVQESQEAVREFCGSRGEFWKISLTPEPSAITHQSVIWQTNFITLQSHIHHDIVMAKRRWLLGF